MRRLYNQDLEAKEVNVRGWNWGQTEFQGMASSVVARILFLVITKFANAPGNNLFFQLGNKPTMEIPLDQVGSTTLTAKNEVNLEFRLPTADQAEAEPEWAKGDQLVEVLGSLW